MKVKSFVSNLNDSYYSMKILTRVRPLEMQNMCKSHMYLGKKAHFSVRD